MSKTVYGEYTIANAIGAVVGYATQDDFGVQETGNVESKEIGGETVQEIISNHGMTASGTVALSDAQKAERIKVGALIRITLPDGTTRPFVVDSWDKSIDTDTGGAVASVSAHSYDSMVTQYEIGPRDPDTGEPLSGKTECKLALYFEDPADMVDYQGATFGIFPTSYVYDGTSAPDMARAIATGKLEGPNVKLICAAGVNVFVAGVTEGFFFCQDTEPDGATETANVFYPVYKIVAMPDASDSSSASA